eukprot:Skav204525  [mRNA]  locus=scaffold4461:94051:102978:- [translate_table: standard]
MRYVTQVVHGDAVLDDAQGVAILSGDVWMVELCRELGAKSAVFVTDVDGVFTKPPTEPGAELVPEILLDNKGELELRGVSMNTASHDVTGGLKAKLESAADVLRGAPSVQFSSRRAIAGRALILTSWTLLIGRYVLTFCLLASLTNASVYYLTMDTRGHAKLYVSLRGMVLGSTPMSARNSLFAAILMASNVVATMMAVVALVIAAETETNPSPVTKKALAAAAHAIEGQTVPCGPEVLESCDPKSCLTFAASSMRI